MRAIHSEPTLALRLPPIMVWGPPGVGKSAVLREVAEEEGIGFIDIRLAQREPVDLRGLPVPDGDVVRWLLASEWPRDPASRGILLFDELTAADRSLQVAAYEILLDRRLGDLYRVPPGWLLLGAGNRASDRAVATSMSSALANRFCHLEITPDLEGWVAWANQRGLDPLVAGFLRFRPALFLEMSGALDRGWPSPRSWERVAHELAVARQTGLDDTLLRLVLGGLVGAGPAAELLAFREMTEQYDIVALLAGAPLTHLPERADQRYGLCTGLAWHLWRVQDRPRAIGAFLDIGRRLPADFATMALVDAVRDADTDRLLSVITHPQYAAWVAEHGSVLGRS
ncbi:ATPase [Deltaproteobacteria bacterium]|nr:ATPase [Deltaproteobacteria bacterium]